jgi:hypothetical protein
VQDQWKFEAGSPPIPIPTVTPTDASRTPHPQNGQDISDDESSASSDASDEDSIVPTAANDPFIAEVQQRCCQCPRRNEGA